MWPRKYFALYVATALVALTSCGGEAGRADDNPPALSEIQDAMWQTMDEEGSVTIDSHLVFLTAGDSIALKRFEQVYGLDDADMQIRGELDGSASAITYDTYDLIRVFGREETYLTGGAVLGLFDAAELEMEVMGELDLSAVPVQLRDTWVDFSGIMVNDGYNIGAMLGAMRQDWYGPEDSPESVFTRQKVSDEGARQILNGTEMWVYPGGREGQELLVEGSRDAPKIRAMSNPPIGITFNDWGETEPPQRPDEAQIVSLEEFEEQVLAVHSDQ